MSWGLPIQSELHSYSLICIFTDQWEWLRNNQSGCEIPTNQNSDVWMDHIMQIWNSYLHRKGPIRVRGRNFHCKPWLSLCLRRSLLVSSWRCISQFATVHLNQVSPFTATRLGTPANFCHNLMKVIGYPYFCSLQNLFLSLLIKTILPISSVPFPFPGSVFPKDISRGSAAWWWVLSTPWGSICTDQKTWAHFQPVGACYNLFPHLELQFSLATVFSLSFFSHRLFSLAKK